MHEHVCITKHRVIFVSLYNLFLLDQKIMFDYQGDEMQAFNTDYYYI